MLDEPLSAGQLSELAAHLGADVPFFLASGPQLGTGDGTQLDPVDLPLDYALLLLLPEGVAKLSTGAVYDEFDRRGGAEGFEARRAELLDPSPRSDGPRPRRPPPKRPRGLAARSRTGTPRRLPRGRQRAGPAVYGLFENEGAAQAAAAALEGLGATRVCAPCRGTVGPR